MQIDVSFWKTPVFVNNLYINVYPHLSILLVKYADDVLYIHVLWYFEQNIEMTHCRFYGPPDYSQRAI